MNRLIAHGQIIMLLLFMFGCGERPLDKNPVSSQGAEAILRELKSLDACMLSPGVASWKKGEELARRIRVSPNPERVWLTESFVRKLEVLGRTEVELHHLPVWLNNFQELVKSVDLCMDWLEDQERPLRLYALCLDRYGDAMRLCCALSTNETRNGNKVEGLYRTLQTDCRIFVENIRKVYLPLVAERRLPQDRYAHWKECLEEKALSVDLSSLPQVAQVSNVCVKATSNHVERYVGRESSGECGGRNCETAAPSLQATRAQEFLGELLLWAPTNGLNHLSVSFPIATGRLERVRRKLLELEEVLLSVSDKVERIVFLRDSANRILGGVVARTNDWEELDYYLSSRIMLDTTASAMWKTSEDGDWIVSLWTRQRWKCMEAERRCREELLVLKEEHRRLTTESYKQALKSVTLRLADLTEADRVIRQELRERKPQIEKRLLVLGWLLDLYPCWDVGELGRKLDGGRLYERFKSLTPEQFREIEDRVKARDGK